jgi:hypothetical protein
MDIHKPKSWHGWREFLKEFGTIVLGVSVALAAEQGAEWLHWRSQVAEARTLIASELAQDVAQGTWRLRTEQCGEHRLDELATILDTASKTGTLPPVGDIGTPPPPLWLSGAWESALGSQAAVHFPREELATLTTIYHFIQRANDAGHDEGIQWDLLYTMVGPGRRLDPPSEVRLREALTHARTINRGMTVISGNVMRRVKALGLPFSANDLDLIARAEREPLAKSRNVFSNTGYICSPIEAVPAVYGQAGWKFVPATMDERNKRYLPFSGQKP